MITYAEYRRERKQGEESFWKLFFAGVALGMILILSAIVILA